MTLVGLPQRRTSLTSLKFARYDHPNKARLLEFHCGVASFKLLTLVRDRVNQVKQPNTDLSRALFIRWNKNPSSWDPREVQGHTVATSTRAAAGMTAKPCFAHSSIMIIETIRTFCHGIMLVQRKLLIYRVLTRRESERYHISRSTWQPLSSKAWSTGFGPRRPKLMPGWMRLDSDNDCGV